MSYLLDAGAPVTAYFARPYDVAQLDAHPDAARVWATILAVREECSSEGSDTLDAALKDAEATGFDDGVTDTLNSLSRLKLTLTETDGFLSIEHNLHDPKFGDLGATLNDPLDDLAGRLNDQLGDVAADLANLSDARTNAKEALAELREMIAATEGLASIDWRTKHDLQQGRVRADSLAKALKKDELANVAMLAIHAIYRLSLV